MDGRSKVNGYQITLSIFLILFFYLGLTFTYPRTDPVLGVVSLWDLGDRFEWRPLLFLGGDESDLALPLVPPLPPSVRVVLAVSVVTLRTGSAMGRRPGRHLVNGFWTGSNNLSGVPKVTEKSLSINSLVETSFTSMETVVHLMFYQRFSTINPFSCQVSFSNLTSLTFSTTSDTSSFDCLKFSTYLSNDLRSFQKTGS